MMNDQNRKAKLTKNQSLVFEAMLQAGQPMGAYALLDQLRDHGFKAPLQIYRALDQLAELGFVHRLESLNAWTPCCEANHEAPPVFAICDDCGCVKEHFDEQLAQRISAMSKQTGFSPNHSIIEIHGKCDDCGSVSTS